jgi:hypothetical protein
MNGESFRQKENDGDPRALFADIVTAIGPLFDSARKTSIFRQKSEFA